MIVAILFISIRVFKGVMALLFGGNTCTQVIAHKITTKQICHANFLAIIKEKPQIPISVLYEILIHTTMKNTSLNRYEKVLFSLGQQIQLKRLNEHHTPSQRPLFLKVVNQV